MTTEKEIKKIFGRFSKIKVAVFGDVMLDQYLYGHVDRISPEAPVPVVNISGTDARCGGAANVAMNVGALSALPFLFSVIGNDAEGDILLQRLKENNVGTKYIVRSDQRITTTKTRILAKNHQMLRFDREVTTDIDSITEAKLIRSFTNFVAAEHPDILIFEDYNKGVLTEHIINAVSAICHENNILIAVDPKHKHFLTYTGCTLFKPNIREINESLGTAIAATDVAALNKAADQLEKQLHHRITMITLGEKGMYVCDGKKTFRHDAVVRTVADVSGAGDTVISIAALCLAAGAETGLMTAISNIAGGMVCESPGVVTVQKATLLQECIALLCK